MPFLFNHKMLSYISRNSLINCVIASLKSRHLSTLKHSSFSNNVRADIFDRRYKSFVSLFVSCGFTQTQVSSLFAERPLLLTLNREKTIRPMLEFFRNNGFSSSDLCHILALDPGIMKRNIEKQIVPSYEYLKMVLKDNDRVVAAVKRSTWLFKQDIEKNLRPNIEFLRNFGVPDDRIAGMLRVQPRTMIQSVDRFRMVAEEVRDMGFEPAKSRFVTAFHVKNGLRETAWKRKWNRYKKWGWSDDEILSAFMRQPQIMAVSEKKVDRVMDFLVNKMGWKISKISCCPAVVMHSLENWTVPRCLVIKFLLSKGVVSEDFPLSTVIVSLESRFVENFVAKYCAEFPEVLQLYASKSEEATGHVTV